MVLLSNASRGKCICLLAVIAFLYLFFGMDRAINIYDEGLVIYGADRVASGDILHRDFYCNYGPAQFYILAAFFKLFSASVLVERLWDTAIRSAIAGVIFLLVDKVASRKAALMASVVSIIWLCSFKFYGYPVFPALLFAIISVYFILPVFNGQSIYSSLFISGISLGVLTLFRYDIGLSTCAVESAVLLAHNLASARKCRFWARITPFIILWGGWGLVFLPVAAAYLRVASFADFYHDVVYFPSRYYAAMRSLPFPTLKTLNSHNILIYFPVLSWIASTIIITTASDTRPADSEKFTG